MEAQPKGFQKRTTLAPRLKNPFLRYFGREKKWLLFAFVLGLKSLRLILLAEDISRQPNNDSVTWLLLTICMQIHNKREQGGKKNTKYKIQNVQFEENIGTRKFNVGTKACAERDRKRPAGKWRRGRGVVRSTWLPCSW